ncbi:restriction endonuclease subunit S [Microbulbifer sp. VAAF005]|uniref:restriction endonuclease subunit S n=1 Tax=Microbulbifer sp. VAAF005 TaxID=3034230 RepID=UPI0024AE3919|nr:restriction endonuclease subunit S [Microbulbifer sp. VAAF005]WHI48950.1 restriction endonuclease subunit S [Microbulbifer sp. VAAF005]
MKPLGPLATIRAGHAFRTKLIDDPGSETRVLQMRDIDPSHGVDWQSVVRCQPVGVKKEWLRTSDILLVARGGRNYAYYLDEQPPFPTLAAPHFFHISLRESAKQILLPEFLAWQLNQQPVQDYFKRNAEGSTSKSIRRTIVENTPIIIPSISHQKTISSLHTAVVSERRLAEQLIANGENLMSRICADLLKEANEADPIRGLLYD